MTTTRRTDQEDAPIRLKTTETNSSTRTTTRFAGISVKDRLLRELSVARLLPASHDPAWLSQFSRF
jgi:hypothetical protein